MKRRALFAMLTSVAVSLTFAGFAQAKDKVVAVSWERFQEERWKIDESGIKAALDAAGIKYISSDAQGSAQKQLADVESLINQGADVLIIVAGDSEGILPAVEEAKAAGIPVIGYDRLIEDPYALYVSFDNIEVGRLQAKSLLAVKPEGNYAFVKGDMIDPNATFTYNGQMEILKPVIDAGKIKVVGDVATDGWKPDNAQKNAEQILTANNNAVDAFVSSNDGMAGGIVAALEAQGLAGPGVAVSGQDGDVAALNRVALGTQTVSVWKNSRELGKAAGEAAVQFLNGVTLDKLPGTVTFTDGPTHKPMTSILLAPHPITKDNLNEVIDAGWVTKDQVCAGVAAGSVPACN